VEWLTGRREELQWHWRVKTLSFLRNGPVLLGFPAQRKEERRDRCFLHLCMG